jgi:hypothetical protein
MCGTCSNFTESQMGLKTWSNFNNNKVGLKTWSNFTDAELRQRCSQELNTTAGSLIDSCVAQKKAQMTPTTGTDGTPQWVGYVQGAGTILQNAGQIFQGLFGQQNVAPSNIPPAPMPEEPKGLGAGAWIGIIAGVLLVGGLVWYGVKQSSKAGK